MKEEWRHVKDFANYEISNLGRLRRAKYIQVYKNGKLKIYEPYVHSETNVKGDYFRVILRGPIHRRRSCYIHRLVWETFVGEVPKGCIVHHKDGDYHNNAVSNLEIMSRSQHTLQHHDKGELHNLGKYAHDNFIGKGNPIAKKVYCIELNQTFDALAEAKRATGICVSGISLCCNGKRKTAGGYHWKFV